MRGREDYLKCKYHLRYTEVNVFLNLDGGGAGDTPKNQKLKVKRGLNEVRDIQKWVSNLFTIQDEC